MSAATHSIVIYIARDQRIEPREIAQLGPGEVLIEKHAAGSVALI